MNRFVLLFCLMTISSVNAQELTDTVINTATIEAEETDDTWPRHSLSVGVGPAWITSKVMTLSGEHTWQNGLEFSVEYGCVFRKGLGFGLSFMYNRTSYPSDLTMKQTYIGPTFIYEHIFGEKWKFRGDVSLGYSHYSDTVIKDDGFGAKIAVSMEYMLSKNVSVGLRLMEGSVVFGDDDPYYDSRGIDRLGIMAGLSFRL